MKVTVCDICGKPAVDPDGKDIRVVLDRGDGRVYRSPALELCRNCIATLAALAEDKRTDPRRG